MTNKNRLPNTVLLILVLATVYLLLGIAGVALANPPGYATEIFPSSGIAFVAVLYFGARILPGVWLGSTALNIWVAINGGDISFSTILIAMSIALGATLQAWATSYLIVHIAKIDWKQLTTKSDIVKFILLAGPLACLISASWGNAILLLSNTISSAEFISDWLDWWIGDVSGVILFAPLALTALLRHEALWRIRQVGVALPIAIIVIVLVSGYIYISQTEHTDAQQLLIWQLLFVGLILTSLLQGLLLVITGHYYDAITKVEQQNIDLKESEARLCLSQKYGSIGSWEWDIKTNNLYWSEQIAQLFGYPQGKLETTYDNFLNAIHPDDRDKVTAAINDCIELGSIYDIDHRVIWPDGQVRWVHEKGNVTRDDSSKAIKMLGVVIDIHDKKLLQQEKEVSEERYRRLFELSEDPMWMIFNGDFILANNTAAKILGYDSPKTLTSLHPSQVSPEYQADGQLSFDKANQMMGIALRDGYHRFEWTYKDISDKEFPVEVSLTRIPFAEKEGLFCIWHDISKRKVIEQENIEAKDIAEKANKAKSEFLSSMSHELRTPLNAILGFAQLLESNSEEPLSHGQKESMDYILSSGQHLLNLINDVLELSSIEAGKTELSIEPIQLTDIINDSVTLLTPLAEKSNIKIHVLSDFDITVKADHTKLKQIIINLVSNAIKYNRKGGSVSLDWQQTESDTARISTIDTGIGISETNQKKVFGAFNRLGQENSTIEGTGIGLVVTKDLIEMMGGQIGFDSIENKGSTFWFELPLAKEIIKS